MGGPVPVACHATGRTINATTPSMHNVLASVIYHPKNPQPWLPSALLTPTAFRTKPGTSRPRRMVSSTTRGISIGVTRPYDTYAPDGNRICHMSTHVLQFSAVVTHEHDTCVAMPAEMVDIEDTDLSAWSALDAFDGPNPSPNLSFALSIPTLDLFERRPVQVG